jgi:hypothetical protein
MTSFAQQDNIGTTSSTGGNDTRGVFESLSKFIKVTDTDESTGLENFCYMSDPVVSDEEFVANRNLINDCRGVVFDGKNVVMKAFPYTDEQGPDINMAGNWFDNNGGFENCRVFESHEGALIRMFYFKDKWFITTHRKLNAFKSKWGSDESYGASFKNALKHQIETNQELREAISKADTDGNYYDDFKTILDVKKQYMFLVRNTHANRLVCNGSVDPTMYHVGTFEDGKLDLDHDIKVNKPTEFRPETVEAMIDHVNKLNPADTPGVIIFSNDNRQLKVSSAMYLDMLELRGNQPSVKFRYLQIRSDERRRGMIHCLYPEHVSGFEEYEEYLRRAVKNIHTAYMDRFIHKKHVRVSQAEFSVIRVAHDWFMSGRESDGPPCRVTQRVISDILNLQQATTLNQIIKKIKHDDHVEMQERVGENEGVLEPMVMG